jgi:hypothetical protein
MFGLIQYLSAHEPTEELADQLLAAYRAAPAGTTGGRTR